MWTLILTLVTSAASIGVAPIAATIAPVPGFRTEASCKKAAEQWLKMNKYRRDDLQTAICVSTAE